MKVTVNLLLQRTLPLLVTVASLFGSCKKTEISLPLNEAEKALPGTWISVSSTCSGCADSNNNYPLYTFKSNETTTWKFSAITHTVASDNGTVRMTNATTGSDVTVAFTAGKRSNGLLVLVINGVNYQFTCSGSTLVVGKIDQTGGFANCKYTDAFRRQ